jgi:putative transposase
VYDTNLTDPEWQAIETHFDSKKKTTSSGRPMIHSYRVIFDAILYVLVSGVQWRLLPHDFPPWQTVYYHFLKWQNDGTYKKVNDELTKKYRLKLGRNENPSLGIIDSQSTKATENAQSSGYDGNKKVKGRKKHIVVDTQGNIIDIEVHDANIHDCKGAELFLKSLKNIPYKLLKIIADKGYQGEIGEKFKKQLGIEFEVSSGEKQNSGFVVVAKRWIVERTFAWLGKCRRLCRDYEFLGESVRSMCYLAMIKLLLKRLVNMDM